MPMDPGVWLKLFANAGGITKGYWVDGDVVGGSASLIAALQGFAQEALKAWGKASVQAMFTQKPTVFLENIIALVTCLELLNGWGNPDKGGVLSDTDKDGHGVGASSLNFKLALAELALAIPKEEQWSGPAAEKYVDLNKKMQQCVKAVMAADQRMQSYIDKQARLVLSVRQQFTYTKSTLVLCIFWAWYKWYSNPTPIPYMAMTVGQADSLAFQYKVSALALTAIVGEVTAHCIKVSMNTGEMQREVPQLYDAARTNAAIPTTSTPPRIAVPTTSGTTVSQFPTLSGAAGNISVTSSRPYPVASAKGGSGSISINSTKEPVQPEAPATPAASSTSFTPAATSTTAFTAPPVAQAPQTAKSSTDVSQPRSPVKQAAALDEKVTAPGPVPGANVEGAGEAVGAEGTERAPIEVAAISDQAQEPSPAKPDR
jgi:hypothetical protein